MSFCGKLCSFIGLHVVQIECIVYLSVHICHPVIRDGNLHCHPESDRHEL